VITRRESEVVIRVSPIAIITIEIIIRTVVTAKN
jgi:hypothetical protein